VPRGVDFTVLDELLAHTVLRLSGPAALAAGDMAQG
jgi:hypothetical protein